MRWVHPARSVCFLLMWQIWDVLFWQFSWFERCSKICCEEFDQFGGCHVFFVMRSAFVSYYVVCFRSCFSLQIQECAIQCLVVLVVLRHVTICIVFTLFVFYFWHSLLSQGCMFSSFLPHHAIACPTGVFLEPRNLLPSYWCGGGR